MPVINSMDDATAAESLSNLATFTLLVSGRESLKNGGTFKTLGKESHLLEGGALE